MKRKITNTGRLLIEITKELSGVSFGLLEAFLMSGGSVKQLARNVNLIDRQYHSSLQNLQKSGYIKKSGNDFLITPKAIKKGRILKIESADWTAKKWDGSYRVVVFDIPERLKRERDLFRSLIRRKGFISLQKSVFVAPYADLHELALLREELGISQYCHFLLAKCADTENESALKKALNL